MTPDPLAPLLQRLDNWLAIYETDKPSQYEYVASEFWIRPGAA